MFNQNGVCQCLHEIDNNLPRTKFCTVPCKEQREMWKTLPAPDVLQHKVKIAKYELNNDNSFTLTGYDEFTINYLNGLKAHRLRIVVNGRLTINKEIAILSPNQGYKNIILEAISNYRKGIYLNDSPVAKPLRMSALTGIYKKSIINDLKNKLLAIHVEKCRDTLTKYDLIGEPKLVNTKKGFMTHILDIDLFKLIFNKTYGKSKT
jgi:hypothetical protein